MGSSIKDGNYYPTIVINVDKINSVNGKTKDDFLVQNKLDSIASILGQSMDLEWVRIDISG